MRRRPRRSTWQTQPFDDGFDCAQPLLRANGICNAHTNHTTLPRHPGQARMRWYDPGSRIKRCSDKVGTVSLSSFLPIRHSGEGWNPVPKRDSCTSACIKPCSLDGKVTLCISHVFQEKRHTLHRCDVQPATTCLAT